MLSVVWKHSVFIEKQPRTSRSLFIIYTAVNNPSAPAAHSTQHTAAHCRSGKVPPAVATIGQTKAAPQFHFEKKPKKAALNIFSPGITAVNCRPNWAIKQHIILQIPSGNNSNSSQILFSNLIATTKVATFQL